MAGNPIEAMVLIGLGFRTLSMAPTAIGPVKTMIRSLDAAARSRYLDEIADRPTTRCAAGSKPMPATTPSCCDRAHRRQRERPPAWSAVAREFIAPMRDEAISRFRI